IAATSPATHKAIITLAAPMDRRSDTSSAVSLLDIGFLPTLVLSAVARCRRYRDCHLGYRYRKYQYRLLIITRITGNKFQDTFATLLWATVGRRKDAAHESQNSYRCGQMETVGEGWQLKSGLCKR